MKISTKVLFLFGFTILVLCVRMFLGYKFQNEILANTVQIKDVEAPLGTMSEQVIGYDGILTEQVLYAVMAAKREDYVAVSVYREKYNVIGGMLDALLKRDAKNLLAQSSRSQALKAEVISDLNKLDQDNMKLVAIEKNAFAAIDNKDSTTAYNLVKGEEYSKNKQELYQNYRDWAAMEHAVDLTIREDIYNKTLALIYLDLVLSLIISVLLVILALLLRSSMSSCMATVKRK